MNLNAWRSSLTLAAIVTMAGTIVTALAECTTLAGGATICDAAWLSPQQKVMAGFVLVVLNLVLKLWQGGSAIDALIKPSVIVSPTGDPGTVTQAQVDSGPLK
jgi:hypothetical protein